MANQISSEQLETAYEKAMTEYNAQAGSGASVSRYFFWAGAQFGTELAREIYDESMKQESREAKA